MEIQDCYARDYASARGKFRRAASDAGGVLSAYEHDTARGPAGEALHVDVARFGPADAARQLVVLSGTHGIEAFSGSAAQIAWMLDGGPTRLPADVGVLIVHALDPWGFAHLSRTTQNNVDLNRNFIAHGPARPANPGYESLHDSLVPREWTRETVAATEAALERFSAENGPDALFDCLARGQYTHPQGLNYGGDRREWSNLLLERIVDEHLAKAEKIAFIDWHTGIGDYAEPFFLCFNDEESGLLARAAAWWGDSVIRNARPHGRQRPAYSGLAFHGMQRFLGERPMCGVVAEFGTRGWHMRRMLRLDLWLKFKATARDERYELMRLDLLDAFCPLDHRWRETTIDHAVRITDQAVAGLAAW